MVKKVLLLPVVFVFFLSLQLLLLYAAAFIPNSAIEKHYKESADYLCEKQVFFNLNKDINASKIDRYADSILLNIAWNFDKKLSAVLMDSYYYTDYQNENDNLHDAVYDGKEANKQYMRYWHGSAGIVRLAHTVCNIKQMYIVGAVLIGVLFFVLLVLLVKRGLIGEAAAMTIGMIAVGVWYVPMSLEYLWTFIVMLIITFFAVHYSENDHALMIVLMLSGMITNYLDFLTSETLTLLVPLILVCSIRLKRSGSIFLGTLADGSKKTEVKNTSEKSSVKVSNNSKMRKGSDNKKADFIVLGKFCVVWGVGYAGAWIAKWLLTALCTGANVMPYISGHIEERLYGDASGMGIIEYLVKAVARNIGCLFPLGFGAIGVIFAVIIIVGYLYVCYVYHGNNISGHSILIFALIGFVPIVRYLVLHNHSYLHYFFTYRALMVSVMAMCLIAFEIIDRRYIDNAFFHRRKS